MPTDSNNKQLTEKIAPEMHTFIEKVAGLGDDFFVSGFVFNFEEDFLMHFGNVSPNANLVRIQSFLATCIEHMMQQGLTSAIESPPEKGGSTPGDIANRLAAAVFSAPPETVPEPIRHIASEYLTSRLEGR